jgi:hypothetical protein
MSNEEKFFFYVFVLDFKVAMKDHLSQDLYQIDEDLFGLEFAFQQILDVFN